MIVRGLKTSLKIKIEGYSKPHLPVVPSGEHNNDRPPLNVGEKPLRHFDLYCVTPSVPVSSVQNNIQKRNKLLF